MDGRPHPIDTVTRLFVVAVLSLVVLSAGCGRAEPTAVAATEPAPDEATPDSIADNPFIPEGVNIGDCVSSLPRPGCGNEIRGDSHSALTFGVLVVGLAFIGWRVARGVRRRDCAEAPGGPAPPPSSPPA